MVSGETTQCHIIAKYTSGKTSQLFIAACICSALGMAESAMSKQLVKSIFADGKVLTIRCAMGRAKAAGVDMTYSAMLTAIHRLHRSGWLKRHATRGYYRVIDIDIFIDSAVGTAEAAFKSGASIKDIATESWLLGYNIGRGK
jgi:hypothetical protein